MAWNKSEIQEAREGLRAILKPGDTVYTVLRHVSRSGMYRAIDCYKFENDQPSWLSYRVAKAIDDKFDKRYDAIGVGGCGMDMGFSIVYNLSHALYPDGFECIGQDKDKHVYCPSNDHSNGDRDYGKHWHKDGGYALRHKWM